MKRRIPGPLWIAIVSLGLMVIGKIIAAFVVTPLVLIDAGLSALLLLGIILGHRWAYIVTIVFVAYGTIVSFFNSIQAGLIVLVLDCLVLVPVLVCTRYYFPPSKATSPDEAQT